MEIIRSGRRLVLALRGSALVAALALPACSAGMPTELAEVAILEEMEGIPKDFVSCISVNGKDADPDLLSRLSKTGRSFVAASECTYVMDVSKGSYHQSTGSKAILIDVESNITFSEVKYVSRHNGKWGVRVTLKVKQGDGKWRVVEAVNRIES